jgi:hypothetical protein
MCFILFPTCDNCKAPDMKRARLFAECDHYRMKNTHDLGELYRQHCVEGIPAPVANWSQAGDKTWVHFEDYRWIMWPPRLCARWSEIASVELCQDCAKLFEDVNARLRPEDAVGLEIEGPDATTLELFGDAAHAGLRTERPLAEVKVTDAKIKIEPGQ